MTDQQPDKGDRIAKLLARAGIASRRDIERMIAEGRIALHGVTLDTPATILTTLDGVTVDGHPVAAPPPAQLFLYHKPPGLLVTEHDPAGRPIIYDHLPADLPRLMPVGRLDLNTEGLLLLTTDGGFKRQLELPATGVERTYRARAYGDITQAQLEELIEGIEIEGMRYGPIDANLERRTGANVWIELTLTEGKNREVRRVLEHLGLQVSRLIRTRYGPFVLGDLMPGEIGEVRGHDIGAFRRTLDAPRRTREPMANVEVEARTKPAAGMPAPAPRAPVEERRPRPAQTSSVPSPAPTRPAPATAARPAAATSGWGSRTRPSRPNAAPVPTERFRADRAAPRVERPTTDAPRPAARSDRPHRDAPRSARPAFAGPRTGGGRSDRPDRNAPRADRSAADASRPGAGGGRSDRQRPNGSARGASTGQPSRAERESPRAERSRQFRDRRDDDARPARPVADRPRTGTGRPADKGGARGPAKGPSGGRGHPPRAPKGKR